MNSLFGGLLGLALCAFTPLASAQQQNLAEAGKPTAASEPLAPSPSVTLPPHERESLPPGERRWYGWQNLSLDGGATALGLAALAFASSDRPDLTENVSQGLLFGAVVAYGVGGPTVHLIHQRPWQALGSLGLRGGLPIAAGAVGMLSETCPPADGGDYGNCGLGGLIVGAAAGAVLAMVVDDSLLSWEPLPDEDAQQARLSLAPVIGRDGRRELRLLGTF